MHACNAFYILAYLSCICTVDTVMIITWLSSNYLQYHFISDYYVLNNQRPQPYWKTPCNDIQVQNRTEPLIKVAIIIETILAIAQVTTTAQATPALLQLHL